jgi:hypothetical protein
MTIKPMSNDDDARKIVVKVAGTTIAATIHP